MSCYIQTNQNKISKMNVKKPFERNNNFRRKIKKGHRKICLIRILNLEKPRDSWKCPLHSSKI